MNEVQRFPVHRIILRNKGWYKNPKESNYQVEVIDSLELSSDLYIMSFRRRESFRPIYDR